MAELPPLDSAVLPAGIRARLSSGDQRPAHPPAGGRVRARGGRAAAAARLPGARLFLAQDHAAARRRRGSMSSPPICAAMAAPPAGSADYDDDLRLSACSTRCATRWAWSRRSATARIAAVVGHDFGAAVAAWCALVRPDVFRSLALMSAPFAGPPDLPFVTDDDRPRAPASPTSTRRSPRCRARASTTSGGIRRARPTTACGIARRACTTFLRAYFHHKSADWKDNKPHRARRLDRRRAGQDADLLHHGSGRRHGRRRGAGDAVAGRDRRVPVARRPRARGLCRRVPPERLSGRAQLVPQRAPSARSPMPSCTFSGRTIDVPSIFIAGRNRTGASTSAPARSRG